MVWKVMHDVAYLRAKTGIASRRLKPLLGLLDPAKLPVTGAEQARRVLDPTLPSNELIYRAED